MQFYFPSEGFSQKLEELMKEGNIPAWTDILSKGEYTPEHSSWFVWSHLRTLGEIKCSYAVFQKKYAGKEIGEVLSFMESQSQVGLCVFLEQQNYYMLFSL
ncbi:MAG: hypothetical protein HGA85_06875 [Nanoarchaeota archaeon]|nr:hypothetical protein [Nanoarchaeota archaeon]